MTESAVKVRERPIIFGAESVRAILGGSKTQTRRVVSLLPSWKAHGLTHADLTSSGFWNCWRGGHGPLKPGEPTHQWQYGDEKLRENFQVGLRLWVRETWRSYDLDGTLEGAKQALRYRADREEAMITWGNPMFMPRWASRISLEVTAVRIERLQEITLADCKAEGAKLQRYSSVKQPDSSIRVSLPREPFVAGWNRINKARGFSWASNPWVWVIEFKRIGEAETEKSDSA